MELLLEVPLIQDHSQDDECLLISYISAKEVEFDIILLVYPCRRHRYKNKTFV